MNGASLLERVVLRNYKSIAACDVRLPALVFLVGPNGSGKSNFLDALRLVADSLRTTLDHALRERGGIKDVRRRSSGHPTHFGIRLEFTLRDGARGSYAFRVGARQQGGYEVQAEECVVHPAEIGAPAARYRVEHGEVVATTLPSAPAAASDRLYLVNASGQAPFRAVFDALSRMGFYNLNPDRIRDLQPPDAGELLARDGSNLSSVLAQLAAHEPQAKERIEEFFATVVPGVVGVDARSVGPKETIEFRQTVAGSENPWRFFAASMSDGTLRALGVLVALFQATGDPERRVPLVGIEEPEVALHPAAAGLLLDALRTASATTQVIVTSHSPDLLDDAEIEDSSILAVNADRGVTSIAPLDASGRSVLRDRLYTAGELLRLNQLAPDPSLVPDPVGTQLKLFDEDEE
jgi:predicted ATPase